MTDHSRIELIITTIAGYYEIEWQELWRMGFKGNAPMRVNMVKLMCEHLDLDRFQIADHINYRPQTIRKYMEKPNDYHYDRISREIRMHLTLKRA